jgi:hypothetical protein
MRKVLIDEVLLSKLHNLTEVVELCDASGQVVAKVVPNVAAFNPEEWEPVEPPPLSRDEIERRMTEPGYTLAEVMEHLRKLPCTG